MERDKLESLIIDYIDGKLNAVDKQVVEQELVTNPEAYKLYEQMKEVMLSMDKTEMLNPSESLKIKFDTFLKDEIVAQQRTKTIFFQPAWYRMAAAVALLVIGGGIGYWIHIQQQKETELLALQKEMEQTKQLMLLMIKDNLSASQRIEGVNVAMTINRADDEIVTALVKAMNEDQNSNVRLAALEALSSFKEEPAVRKALVQSLSQQKDPVVQIALIQLLVKMKEKGVVDDLKKIIDDIHTIKPVKDEAYTGLMKLS